MKLKYAYDELAWVISEACELRPLFFENGQSGNRIADDQLRRNQDLVLEKTNPRVRLITDVGQVDRPVFKPRFCVQRPCAEQWDRMSDK